MDDSGLLEPGEQLCEKSLREALESCQVAYATSANQLLMPASTSTTRSPRPSSTRLPRLFDELILARAGGSYPTLMSRFARTDVLVLDDWGLAVLEDSQRQDILEILEDRDGARSTS